MDVQDAEKIRKQWGDKPCDHPHLEKEYYLGAATGDYVCTQCGCSGDGSDWPLKEKKRKENNL